LRVGTGEDFSCFSANLLKEYLSEMTVDVCCGHFTFIVSFRDIFAFSASIDILSHYLEVDADMKKLSAINLGGEDFHNVADLVGRDKPNANLADLRSTTISVV
jgi:hypothetical protein